MEIDAQSLPKNWVLISIKEVFNFTSKPRNLNLSVHGSDIPFLPMDIIPIGKMKITQYEFRPVKNLGSGTYIENGDLLLAKITPSFENGKQAILDIDRPFGYATTEVIPIQELPDVSDKEFLYHLLLHPEIRSNLAGKMEGSTGRQRLSKTVLGERLIPFPPLSEQKKIAYVLSTVQLAIAQQEQLIQTTTELKKALMHKLFTEGLHGEKQKETAIGLVPKSWILYPCEKICLAITVGIVVKPASYYVPDGIPAFRSLNVHEDKLNVNNLVFVSPEDNDNKLAKSKLKIGDVLIVRTGYPGTSCVVPKEYDGSNCIDVVIAKPNHEIITSEFFSRYFNSESGKKQVLASKHGLAQQHLNVGAVKRTLMPTPPTLDEQRQITQILDMIDKKRNLADAKRNVLNDLFQTLLHQLMTAKTRVHDIDLPGFDNLANVTPQGSTHGSS